MNRVGIFVIQNNRISVPNLFNFGNIFALSIFETFVASKVFTFKFHCVMPRRAPVDEIRCPAEQV